jgi:hypothetical protein
VWIVALAAFALIVPPASAATLASPPITAAGGGLVECSIANLAGAVAKVTIRVIDNDAELTRAKPVTVAGHRSQSADAFCKGVCNRPRCEFETSRPAGEFRASACVADHTNTNVNKVCLPAQ